MHNKSKKRDAKKLNRVFSHPHKKRFIYCKYDGGILSHGGRFFILYITYEEADYAA